MVAITFPILAVYLLEAGLFLLYAHAFTMQSDSSAKTYVRALGFVAAYLLMKVTLERYALFNLLGMSILAAGYLLLFGFVPKRNCMFLGCIFALCIELPRLAVYGLLQRMGNAASYTMYAWTFRICASGMKLLCVCVMRHYLKNYALETIEMLDYCQLIVPFSFLLFIRYGVVEGFVRDAERTIEILFFMLCLATGISMLAIIYRISFGFSQKQVRQIQMAMLDNYKTICKMQTMEENLLRIRHDMRHYLYALTDDASSHEQEQFARELLTQLEKDDAVAYSGHATLDSMLDTKNRDAAARGVRLELLIQPMDFSFVQPIDLCSFFGNALDNAVEATEKLNEAEKRVVTVKSVVRQGVWVLKVSNPYGEEPLRRNDVFLSRKTDGGLHGIGLKSIQYCAQKYHGRVELETRDHVFTLLVMLPVNRP